MLRAVLFDWGHTLARYHLTRGDDPWRSVATLFVPEETVLDFAARLSEAELAMWRRLATDQRSATLGQVIEAVCREFGISPSGQELLEAIGRHERAWEQLIDHDSDVTEVLQALRGVGLRIGLVSNTLWSDAFIDGLLRRDRLIDLVGVRVYTSGLPFHKPHPLPFATALQMVDAQPDEAVFVGDRMFDDVFGASRVGMRTVLREGVRDTVEDGNHEGVLPDARIRSLPELIPILEGWTRDG